MVYCVKYRFHPLYSRLKTKSILNYKLFIIINGCCSQEMENEDDEDVLETEVSDLDISQLKPTNEETKPDFDSGRQLMEWLRMKLDYLEVHVQP